MKNMKARFAVKAAERAAKKINKEDLLSQLKAQWAPLVKKDANLEIEVKKAWDRIESSGLFRKVFDIVGITEEDIRKVLSEIIKEKKEDGY